MGLLGKYRSYQDNRLTKKIAKASRLANNPKAIKDDRWAALQFLSKEAKGDVPAIVKGLLQRFEYSLEHGINDSREKDLALEGVLRFGKEAQDVIVDWLKSTDGIAWPLKALKQISEESVFVESLKSILVFEDVSMTASAVDKNFDILCYLRDYQLGDFAMKLDRFLKDPDERVRFAACEVILDQDNKELSPLVEDFLLDETTENRRLRQAVADSFYRNKWEISDLAKFSEWNASDLGYRLGEDRLLVK